MMSDARKTPETGSTGNRLEQVLQHPEHVSDSAEQLRDRLADLVFNATEESFDAHELEALLSALDEVAPIPEDALPDPRKSLEEFHRRHDGADSDPAGPDFHSSTKKIPRKMTLRKLLPIAAIFVLIVCLMTPMAYGRNIFQEIGRWTAEIFQLEDNTDNYAVIRNRPLAEGESKEYATPQEMLEDFGLDAKLVPAWVPERLGEPSVRAKNGRQGMGFFIDCETENEFLSVYFAEMPSKELSITEKDYQDARAKKIDGIKHYVIIDKDITKIVWENGELECHITGDLPREEMEQVLDSIYED